MYSFDRLLQAGTGLAACLFLAAAPLDASARPQTRMPGPTAAVAAARDAAPHIQTRPTTWDSRAPLPSSREHLYRAYGEAQPQTVNACNIAGFAGASGAALVEGPGGVRRLPPNTAAWFRPATDLSGRHGAMAT